MSSHQPQQAMWSRLGRRTTSVALALVAAGAVVPTGASYASSKPFLEALRVKGSTPVLVNSSHETLYLLSSEKSSHLHCSGACLTYWPPVLVKKSIARVSLGPGVRGKVGFVARPGAMKQVTFNSYPLYRFAGDGRAGSTNGEGLVSYGGTWYVLKAASTTANATPLKKFVTRPAPAGY